MAPNGENGGGAKRLPSIESTLANAGTLIRSTLVVLGFLLLFVRLGEWYGRSETQLTAIREQLQRMNTQLDLLTSHDINQEARLLNLERTVDRYVHPAGN